MNLNKAAICMDCYEVFNGQNHDYCPICGGKASTPASNWIRPLCEAAESAQPVEPVATVGGAHGSA